ncbi:PAS domain-containing sensor histidine kinase [Desulfosporosinus sp. FKA]|uniref:PAS domain-containing sensor histidine kinase n=1 Tax=Desulfosporosinus sp. FKA TaxID=1969834 RepID=UPI000B4A50D3|nr:PAS domain-containing sensor histidine kinase [Desulfosporosinus sp. FKA]
MKGLDPQIGPESIHLPWWYRIRVRTLLFGVLASILPVLLISGYYLYFAKLDLQRSVQTQNNLLVARIAQEVDLSLEHTEESLKSLAINLTDPEHPHDDSQVDRLRHDPQLQLQFYRFLQEFPLADEVVLLNAQGEAIGGVSRFRIFQPEMNWANPNLLKNLTLDKLSYSDVHFLSSGIPTVKIVVPLDADADFSGGIGIQLRLRGLLTTLKTPNPLPKADLFVVDPSGRLIADSDVTRLLEKADVRQSYTVQNFLMYKNPQELPALNQYLSYTGQEVIGGYEVLPRNGWGVMVEQPVAVAFAPINQLITRFLIFILFILVISISASIVYGLSITRPVERLEEAAWIVSRGRLEERVPEDRKDELGQLAGTFNFMMERLQAQSENLIQEKERLDTIVHGIGAGLALLEKDFSVTWMNPVLEHWVGEGFSFLPQKDKCYTFFGNSEKPCENCPLENSSGTDWKEDVISYLNRPDEGNAARQKIFRHRLYPLNHARPNEPGYLMVIEDITEQRRMEDLIIQADKLSALGLLASGFAHEINNPLAIIQGYAEDLEEQIAEPFVGNGGTVPERMKRSLRTIRKHVGRAQRITQSLLNFSRKSEWKVEEIGVEQVIEESLALLEILLRKKQIRVMKRWESPLPGVKGDALQLVQVFVNILSNAVDALPEQGELQIEVQTRTKKGESILEITVHDNGEGIAPELLSKIFDPFFTTKEVGKGTGLGLAISYGIIARMGGTIQIESEPCQGTKVQITLPVIKMPG